MEMKKILDEIEKYTYEVDPELKKYIIYQKKSVIIKRE